MRMLIGALSVAMLAGCASPAMDQARNKSPVRVLASDKAMPLVAECVQFSWQDETVFGVDASGYITTDKAGKMTVYTRGGDYFTDLQTQGTGTSASYYAPQPDAVAMRRLAALATCL